MNTSTATLFEALSSIPDHRTRKGRRYPLAAILAISIAAMLSGANDLRAIFRWGRRLSPRALQALGVDKKRKRAPCHATYHYVFKELPLGDLTRALGRMEEIDEAPDGRLDHIAIDGKRLRGSRQGSNPGVHILHAFSTRLQAAVGSLVVPPDSGEMIEVLELLKALPLEGAVVTGDAGFTYETVVDAIREAGGDYFLLVKGNQPELRGEIAHAFGDDSPLSSPLSSPLKGRR
jgi:hypothetical protein